MITRQEYNKALDIVEKYNDEMRARIRECKTRWDKWDKLNECDTRLRQVIINTPNFYLEDVIYSEFIKLRNAGIKSWDQFVELRGY